jgi:protein-S-isoprenylcysteine O-methyltransferase Ste14
VSRFLQIISQNTAWLACIVYSTIPAFWLMVHPFAGFWRSRKGNPYKFLVPIWITLWIAVAAVTKPFRHTTLYAAHWMWLPAAALLITGIAIYRRSGARFTWSQLGGLPEIRNPQTTQHPQRLVTEGIRKRVRHPIYLGHLCEMLAWSLGSGLIVCYGLTALAIVTGAIMIYLEDAELEKRFGDDYRRYKENVPAIFPGAL